jgi:hypothetical protein
MLRTVQVAVGLASLLLALDASAAVTVSLTSGDTTKLSRVDCQSSNQTKLGVTWKSAGSIEDKERVFVSTSSTCPLDGSNELLTLVPERKRTAEQSNFDGTNPVFTQSTVFQLLTGDSTCPVNIEKRAYVCVVIGHALGGIETASLELTADSTPAGAPTLTGIDAMDSGLKPHWTAPSGNVGMYRVYYKAEGGNEEKVEVSGTETSAQLSKLTNDKTYTITVTAFDDSGSPLRGTTGNESERSNAMTSAPRASQDFLERYTAMNGGEQGGCASSGVSLLGLLALFALLSLRRRRVAPTLFVLCVLVAGSVSAQESSEPKAKGFGFALQIGAYRPDVDGEKGLTGTPYKDIFGTSSPKIWQLDANYDLLKKPWGAIGMSASVGTWRATGHARYPQADDAAASDEVYLYVTPISPALYFRADIFQQKWRIPVLPYASAGFGFAKWSTSTEKGSSTATRADGKTVTGTGWARGFEWNAGLHLLLNWLDPQQASNLARETGIVRTSLFAEYRQTYWRGAGGLRLDGGIWSGGIALGF